MKNLLENQSKLQNLFADNNERLKELQCINQINRALTPDKSIETIIKEVCEILPKAFRYHENAVARILYDKKEFSTKSLVNANWYISHRFETIDGTSGITEIYYNREFPDSYEGPFLKQERELLNKVSLILCNYLNSIKAKHIIQKPGAPDQQKSQGETEPKISGRQLLQKYLAKQNSNSNVFHDLMPFKATEVLLYANLYDAYNIEKEGRFAEQMLGVYYQLNLSSVPRVTGVSSSEELFSQLHSKHFDLVIFMVGIDKKTPALLSHKIREDFPYIPVFALLNNNNEIKLFKEENISAINKIFVWNGDTKVFFAMLKYLEDKINADNDTKIGMVRIILLVEDSEQYYSRYLPMLYTCILEQTKLIMEDVGYDEFLKIIRLRARPKILLASTYEEALEIYTKYRDHMLCLISDVKFPKGNKLVEDAGFKLLDYIKADKNDIPAILQSLDAENEMKAKEKHVAFINKNSDSVLQELRSFITNYLGFGNFIYKNNYGEIIGEMRSVKDLEYHLRNMPDELLSYHAQRDSFSMWLMARGEIQMAKMLKPYKSTDFKSTADLREFLVSAVQKHKKEQNKGKILNFEENENIEEGNIISLASGSIGGKGRGLTFINTLIYNFGFQNIFHGINLKAPKTLIIGTDEFEIFIKSNNLFRHAISNDTKDLKNLFLRSRLSNNLVSQLSRLIKLIDKPIAVRSSGLFEDSLSRPFAGVFETYILPNNADFQTRLNELCDAIRLVYASVYSEEARNYVEAINYNIEDEKMAVIIQEVVGQKFDNYFYPHISGVAQSYNYYPVSYMKPEEGFAICALGLGKYVVDGEKCFRFSPKYPSLEINSLKDQLRNTQEHFYAVNLNSKSIDLLEGENAGLIKLSTEKALAHGSLKHLASIYDFANDRINPGTTGNGPIIINFANILKYNYIPMAETIEFVLNIVKEAMGSPVEIEFAIDLNKDESGNVSFYLLQIKPLIEAIRDYEIEQKDLTHENMVIYSEKAMGNGELTDIRDVIFIDNEQFDKSKTEEMAIEIEELNKKMIKQNKKYILIGPGRWGTRDKWIGIPVNWPQISNAKIIIETSLESFPLDASSGSHFFHNLTSMNVGYFSVQPELSGSYISYDLLCKQKTIEKTKFFRHVQFKKNLTIKVDGKKRIAIVKTQS